MTEALKEHPPRVEESLHEDRFERLAAEWKRDTLILSKTREIINHIAYQKIIGMGPAAVPLILKDMATNGPNLWFWALHVITDANPVPSGIAAGDIKGITEAWLQWGRRQGYPNACPQPKSGTFPT